MDYTYCTIVIPAAALKLARADYPNYFNAGYSADGSAPATSYAQSGPFANTELDDISNEQKWPRKMYFGNNTQEVLTTLGLMPVQEKEDAL